MKYKEQLNNENDFFPNIFSVINKKNLIIKILNALPDDLKSIIFQLSELDKKIALMAIKTGDLKLINYMTNWDYESLFSTVKDIKMIDQNYLYYTDFQQFNQDFKIERKENYIDNETAYLRYLSRVFNLQYNLDEFKIYVKKLIENENNLNIKKMDKEFHKEISLSLKLQEDLKFLYKLKIRRVNKITEIAEIDKRYEEVKKYIEKCMKDNAKKQIFFEKEIEKN